MNSDAERLLADISDDWYALWEVEQLLSKLAPNLDAASRRQLVQGLVEQELLQLFTGEGWSRVGNAAPLPTNEAVQIIASPEPWQIPRPSDPIYAVGVSEHGLCLQWVESGR